MAKGNSLSTLIPASLMLCVFNVVTAKRASNTNPKLNMEEQIAFFDKDKLNKITNDGL
jgi:hypothetical protein